jgi:hypothetical protein
VDLAWFWERKEDVFAKNICDFDTHHRIKNSTSRTRVALYSAYALANDAYNDHMAKVGTI